jgi:hypothetical protein
MPYSRHRRKRKGFLLALLGIVAAVIPPRDG